MTAKHQTPEYRASARTVKGRVSADRRAGRPVICWRCRRALGPREAFDVGHLPGARGSSIHELAPEHRHATDYCKGNRAAGGRTGAQLMHARRAPITTPPSTVTRYQL